MIDIEEGFMMNRELIDKIIKFRDNRDWKQFHTGKDLAISLSLEASELLEIFQWSGTDLQCIDKLDKIKEELADVLMYSILMADCYNLDIEKIIEEKLAKNSKKYPVDKAKGNAKKYDEL
jgi:NTP pyrophosphatase (non-canonical NTP hydrolase)